MGKNSQQKHLLYFLWCLQYLVWFYLQIKYSRALFWANLVQIPQTMNSEKDMWQYWGQYESVPWIWILKLRGEIKPGSGTCGGGLGTTGFRAVHNLRKPVCSQKETQAERSRDKSLGNDWDSFQLPLEKEKASYFLPIVSLWIDSY